MDFEELDKERERLKGTLFEIEDMLSGATGALKDLMDQLGVLPRDRFGVDPNEMDEP